MSWISLIDSSLLEQVEPDDFLLERIKLFDVVQYKKEPDISEMSNDEALAHFVVRGKIEGRVYNQTVKSFIDPEFYLNKYAHFCLKDHNDAIKHWMYTGVFMGLAPNSVACSLLEAEIHLFQMGKVGSMSIFDSLNSVNRNIFIPHLHFASEVIKTYPDSFYSYPEIIRLSNQNLKFISGVRDPVERVLSGLLQFTLERRNSLDDVFGLLKHADDLDRVVKYGSSHIINWFDHNYYCDIDVYSSKFDLSRGFCIVHNNKNKVFLYRVDKLNDVWPDLSKFTRLSLPKRIGNVTSQKGKDVANIEKQLYASKFSREVVEEIYSSKYCTHFFTAEEIERSVDRWSR